MVDTVAASYSWSICAGVRVHSQRQSFSRKTLHFYVYIYTSTFIFTSRMGIVSGVGGSRWETWRDHCSRTHEASDALYPDLTDGAWVEPWSERNGGINLAALDQHWSATWIYGVCKMDLRICERFASCVVWPSGASRQLPQSVPRRMPIWEDMTLANIVCAPHAFNTL